MGAGPPLKVPLTTLMSKHQDTWRAIQVCGRLSLASPPCAGKLPPVLIDPLVDTLHACRRSSVLH